MDWPHSAQKNCARGVLPFTNMKFMGDLLTRSRTRYSAQRGEDFRYLDCRCPAWKLWRDSLRDRR
jgi:hypothetical protein